MNFGLNQSLSILERTPKVLKVLLENLSPDWTHQNEGESTWSPYDVVGHLIHGEKTDWMERVRIILADDKDKEFKPFDRFAQFEDSKGKSLLQLLNEFEELRNRNLKALNDLNITEEKLKLEGIHPHFGKVTMKQLLATWTAHDLGHIAQICRVMAKQYQSEVGPWEEYLGILKS